MRIVQITDLHIGQPGEDTFGVDVRGNLKKVLAHIRRQPVDYLILSGDLCYRDPELAIFQYVKKQLDETQIPYSVIPGNHDNSLQLAEVFCQSDLLKGEELFFRLELEGLPIILLDTAVGQCSKTQKDWLSHQLQSIQGDQVIFMHHPPTLAQVPYMDNNHALQDWAEIQDILHQAPGEVHVFCGHYHISKTIHKGSLHIYITPSCFFQIDPSQEDFAVDHHRIGYRDISWDGSELQERVIWVD